MVELAPTPTTMTIPRQLSQMPLPYASMWMWCVAHVCQIWSWLIYKGKLCGKCLRTLSLIGIFLCVSTFCVSSVRNLDDINSLDSFIYEAPGLLSFLPALPVGSIILSNSIWSCFNNSQDETANKSLVVMNWTLKLNIRITYQRMLMACCVPTRTQWAVYTLHSANVSSLADK